MRFESIILLFFGLVFIGLGALVLWLDHMKIKHCTKGAQGRVMKVEMADDLDTIAYNAQIQYKANHAEHRIQVRYGIFHSKLPKPGEHVTVYYDPSNPAYARTDADHASAINTSRCLFVLAFITIVIALLRA